MPLPGQLELFDDLPPPPPLAPAAFDSTLHDLARELPPTLWLGTSSWSFPGWQGIVYSGKHSESTLAKQGLPAYARHPLLRCVGLDRTYYNAVNHEVYHEYAMAVPADFRFMVKAPEILTAQHFRGGQLNPDFLSTERALRDLIEPASLGLQAKLGCLLFQFPPQSVRELGGPRGFATRLYQFFEQLPRGLPYAVELRNRDLFSPAYCDVLDRLEISHCLNVHPLMPEPRSQLEAARLGPLSLVRWMLNPRLDNYQQAYERLEPFNSLKEEDSPTRIALARLCRRLAQEGRTVMVIVNNKAEGCAPLSLRALACAIQTP